LESHHHHQQQQHRRRRLRQHCQPKLSKAKNYDNHRLIPFEVSSNTFSIRIYLPLGVVATALAINITMALRLSSPYSSGIDGYMKQITDDTSISLAQKHDCVSFFWIWFCLKMRFVAATTTTKRRRSVEALNRIKLNRIKSNRTTSHASLSILLRFASL
jgi:hypothetical protein